MHQPITDHLESYLRDSNDHRIPREFHAHLAGCRSCERDLRALSAQSLLLRAALAERAAEEPVEPRPGFYARVLNRIEDQKVNSFWSGFLEPVLGRRLVYACGALVVVLGTYLVGTETQQNLNERNQNLDVVISQSQPSTAIDGAVQPRDRDAVLVNLASFHE
jgi:anti-sigma factor RsiW